MEIPFFDDNVNFQKKFDEPDTYHFPSAPEELFRNIYFEVYDPTVNGIKERFNQPDYRIYVNLQELILKAFNKEDFSKRLEAVIDFHDSDFERFDLVSDPRLNNIMTLHINKDILRSTADITN